jgi:protoporphyrin/coproporphyrin ferrochelatase
MMHIGAHTKEEKIGVVIMTYGSATTRAHVREYFNSIYKSGASEEVIVDFERRYDLVGHSPLIDITKEQARLLEASLGDGYIVRAGMRHSAPQIHDAVRECVGAGATSIRGIILAPQFSSFIMEGYRTAFFASTDECGLARERVHLTTTWQTESHFIALMVSRITIALRKLRATYGAVPVIFTTHSLPLRVVEKDPTYLQQLSETITAIRAGLPHNLVYYEGYQSAGHTPEPWLTPDLKDILATLCGTDTSAVLIVPIQFLSDHLEVLYDLDIAARAECEEYGIAYNRIELPNTDPRFIEALASLARR